jgi:hypothetical protein
MKPRRIIWSGYVTRIEKKRNVYKVLVGFTEVKRPHEEVDVNGKIILK